MPKNNGQMPVVTPQQVALSSPLKATSRRIRARPPVGIALLPDESAVIRPQNAPVGQDFNFPNNPGSSTSLSFHGGAIATGVPVQLIFWGSIWNQPSTSPSMGELINAVQKVLAGPFMSALRQYGIRRSPFRGAIVVTSPEPPVIPDTFTDISSFENSGTIEHLVNALINDGKFPEPDEDGGRNIYCVFMPPNTRYDGGPGVTGAHTSFTSGSIVDVDTAWYAWVGNGPLATMTRTFGHELVETCTDPEGDGWTIDGVPTTSNEIGDICNQNTNIVNGVTLEPYWSIFDRECVLPTSFFVRRTLAFAGKKLNGKGILSLQSSIPSLNEFISRL